MFFQVKNPPQWMLDNLLKEDESDQCPDCQAGRSEAHSESCDVARCHNTGVQRIQCCCPGGCTEDIWDGHWPGIQRAYDRKLVCYDTASGFVMLDLNAAAIAVQLEKSGAEEEDIQRAIQNYWDKH